MKRFLSIVLALCMVFALCACGNDSNNGGSDADSSKYDKISIDLSCNGQSDTANDCIGANLFSTLKSSPAVRSLSPFTTTISLPAAT